MPEREMDLLAQEPSRFVVAGHVDLPQANSRDALRDATSAAHGRLHQHRGFAALLRGNLARPAYGKLLLQLLGLHEAVDARLAALARCPWLAWHGSAPGRSRPACLHDDLTALGLSTETIATPAVLVPKLGDPTSALGCPWVVEGSALGGQLLARNIAVFVGPNHPDGGSFFRSGPTQAARWRTCRAAVELCGVDMGQHPAMLRGATGRFDAFETWLGDGA